MIYLTKSFTCVIVSAWCYRFGFQSIFEDAKAWRIASLLSKFIPITNNRRQERCIVKTRVMFVDLMSYVKGMLTHCQQ